MSYPSLEAHDLAIALHYMPQLIVKTLLVNVFYVHKWILYSYTLYVLAISVRNVVVNWVNA